MVSCLSALGILIGRSRHSKKLASMAGLRPSADIIGRAGDTRKWTFKFDVRGELSLPYGPVGRT